MIRITKKQLLYFTLQKNYLTLPLATEMMAVCQMLAGLPAQNGFEINLALQARVELYNFSMLDDLWQTKKGVLAQLQRNDWHLVATADYLVLHAATWRQRRQYFFKQFIEWGVELSTVDNLSAAVLGVFDDQPLTLSDMEAHLPEALVYPLEHTTRGGRLKMLSNIALMVDWLLAKGELVKLPQADFSVATWLANKDPIFRYLPLKTWGPNLTLLPETAEAEAQTTLARTYLAAFGPVSEADFSFWSGLGKSETARALNNLQGETTLVMVDGLPGAMLLLKREADALKACQPPAEPHITLLGVNDTFMKACRATRARFFDNATFQRLVFRGGDDVLPTVLVNGAVVGIWRCISELDEFEVNWEAFVDLEPDVTTAIEGKVDEMRTLLSRHRS